MASTINYMREMSKEEIEESNKKIEKWWASLERNLKLCIYQTNEKIFKQMYCVHDFKTNKNIDFEYCNICNLHKRK